MSQLMSQLMPQPVLICFRFRAAYDGRESSSSLTDGSPVSQPPLSVPTTQQQHQQFLGDASAAMPEFGHINLLPDQLPPGLSQKHLLVFEELYKDHCEVSTMDFSNSCVIMCMHESLAVIGALLWKKQSVIL